LTILLDSANDFVESYVSRELESDTRTEYHDGNAQREVMLDVYPATSITSFEKNVGTLDAPVWEAVPASTYKLSPKDGKVFLLGYSYRGFQNYKIVYVGGYATMPGDLRLATLKLAGSYWNKRTSDGIKKEGVAGDSLEFDTSEVSSDVMIILNSYRDV